MKADDILRYLNELQSSQNGENLSLIKMELLEAFGKHGHQRLALECATRGLACFWHKATTRYLILKRDQWEDLSR